MNDIKNVKELYLSAFPADERREFDALLKLAEAQNDMRLKIEYLDGELLGFLIYWVFEHFIYLEHFAVNEQFRGKGHGAAIFKNFLKNASKPVILEVEPPENAIAGKRIKFYERLGMILNSFPYTQPPYSCEKKPVKMMVMSSRNINGNDFEKIKKEIFGKVYNRVYVN